MKTALLAILLVCLPTSAFGADKVCGSADRSRSTKNKYMGIPGNNSGRDCPGRELFWVPTGESTFELCLANGKKTPVQIPDGGLAIFSPNCKFFWSSGGYADGSTHVLNAATGKDLGKVRGNNPAWSVDSNTLFYFSKENQISARDMKTKKSRTLLIIPDYQSCRASGEGLAFTPVKAVSENEITWQYTNSTTPKEGAPGSFPGKQITIDPANGGITQTAEGVISCGR